MCYAVADENIYHIKDLIIDRLDCN